MATTKKLPKGMALEQKKIEAAQEGHYYIKVGPKGGSHWVLSGAPSRWKKSENRGDIYVPDFRVAGRVEDLTEALRNTGTDESDIQDALSRAYTADNFDTTMKAEFDAEVDLYRDAKKKKGKVAPEFTLDDLEYIVAHVSSAKRVSRSDARSPCSPTGKTDATAPAPKAAKRGGGGQGPLNVSRLFWRPRMLTTPALTARRSMLPASLIPRAARASRLSRRPARLPSVMVSLASP